MKTNSVRTNRIIYGVDFSGAKDAGKKVWITAGAIKEGALTIVMCSSIEGNIGHKLSRDQVFGELVKFIKRTKRGIFGFDFPFGIPDSLVSENSWEEFVLSFKGNYSSPEEFAKICRSRARGKELKRLTDTEARTPFSPYNLWLYRQTYFGIRNVLEPLIRSKEACILPMQLPLRDKSWVVEICPASTLKAENLYIPYKGKGSALVEARKCILENLEAIGLLKIGNGVIVSKILENKGGDALDSVIAAFATFRALKVRFVTTTNFTRVLEGYVYI